MKAGRLWPGDEVQRILGATARPLSVIGHVGNTGTLGETL